MRANLHQSHSQLSFLCVGLVRRPPSGYVPGAFKDVCFNILRVIFQAQYTGGARKSASGILDSAPVEDYRPGKQKAPINKHLYLDNKFRLCTEGISCQKSLKLECGRCG